MKIKQAEFVISNTDIELCPKDGKLEYAFIGRSNVGKSSLINMLMDRNKLAKTSGRPGKTQLINHFIINEEWYVVDLPGYGYAKASKTDIARWTKLTRQFLFGRASLRRVFLLIDSRHGLKESDLELMAMLDETAVTYQLILTKVDKLKKGELDKVVEKTEKAVAKRPAAFPQIINTSSETKNGLDLLRAEIASLALP